MMNMKQTSLGQGKIKPTIESLRGGKINPEMISENEVIEVLFDYYQRVGFPYYANQDKYEVVRRLRRFDTDKLLTGDEIGQTMHGLSLCNTYFHHLWETRYKDSLTPVEVYKDDEKFRIVLREVWRWCVKHEGARVSDNRVRQGLKIYGGAYGVSNFRPTVGKFIYDNYGELGRTWDMCAGWGGRLLGAIVSTEINEYIGTEPSIKTFNGLMKMSEDLSFIHNKKITILRCGSENYLPDEKSLDLCFTSPPYFDTEKYADDATQSYVKFPSVTKWLNGFIRKTVQNCHYGLREDGHLIINVSNPVGEIELLEPIKNIIEGEDFDFVREYKMVLSSIAGKGKKYEPILVFKKVGTA